MARKLRVFYSFAANDKDLLDKVDTHLAILRRSDKIEKWDRFDVTAGDDVAVKMKEAINSADIILLMVSANYIASDEQWDTELMVAMEKHDAGVAKVVPIYLRDGSYEDMPFAKLQKLPRSYPSLSSAPNMDQACTEIAAGIRELVNSFVPSDSVVTTTTVTSTPAATPVVTPAATPSSQKPILFIAANPLDTERLNVQNEYKMVKQQLASSTYRDRFSLELSMAASVSDFTGDMAKIKPTVLHYSGHGKTQGILVDDGNGNAVLMPTMALKMLVGQYKDVLECVFLNSCYSEDQAKVLSIIHPEMYVVGMNQPLDDRAGVILAKGFYQGLGNGMSYPDAFRNAMIILMTELPTEQTVPELWNNGQKVMIQ